MARSRRRSKNTALAMPDLSGVESKSAVPEDDYRLKIVDIEDGEGDAGPYYKWSFDIASGKYKGKKPKPYYTSLAPDSLWNLRNLLEALEVEIPDSEFEMDKEELIGLELVGTVEDDQYQGRISSAIVNFMPLEEEEEEEKPKRGKKKDEEEEEEGEEEEEEKPRRRRSSKKRDEEEEEKPKRGKRGGKKKETVEPDDIDEMDEDELWELVENRDLGVDLDDFKTVRKMRNAVKDAAEEAGILAD